jgi:hypothetical protein
MDIVTWAEAALHTNNTCHLADQCLRFWGRVKAPLLTSSHDFSSPLGLRFLSTVVSHFSTLSQFGTLPILLCFPVP